MTKKKTVKKPSRTDIVPDTSVIAEALVFRYIQEKKIHPEKIIIPEAVVNELEHQANQGRETGYIGLDEVKLLQKNAKKFKYSIEFVGKRPGEFEIRHAKSGAVDHLIRQTARDHNAMLMTADRVQGIVAEAQGIKTLYVDFSKDAKEPEDPLKKFFDKTTMSVHIKEGSTTTAKRGRPGGWEFKKLKHKPEREAMQELAKAIVEAAQIRIDGFIEIERKGSTIVQLGNYRIVIAKPPFASCWEITAVRPVAHLSLKDYEFPEKFQKRLEEKAEGILVSGSPGEGKSTFTQALGEFYANQEKIVKTVEAPRDLVLPDTITQYSASHGSPEEIRDVLLLNRPDYTIYDEIRNTRDFQLFADMRLSGVGMIGVVHATSAVDSIQRFVGRIELGMIPQVVDTVVFIKAGAIAKVYTIAIQVKVPSGMTEADLARPVVIVNDFYTGKPEFEIYTYGDQTTVVPVTDQETSNPLHRLAEASIQEYLMRFSGRVEVQMQSDTKATVFVPESQIASIIGKGGSTIQAIEKELGLKLDVQSLSGDSRPKPEVHGKTVHWEAELGKRAITIELPPKYANQEIDLYEGDRYLMSATAGKHGTLKITTSSQVGKVVRKALQKDRLEIRV